MFKFLIIQHTVFQGLKKIYIKKNILTIKKFTSAASMGTPALMMQNNLSSFLMS